MPPIQTRGEKEGLAVPGWPEREGKWRGGDRERERDGATEGVQATLARHPEE